jgi:hypothetical protein
MSMAGWIDEYASRSGETMVCVVIEGDHILLGQLGDSKRRGQNKLTI